MRRLPLLLPLLVLPALFAACDLEPKDEDEDYVRGFCRATNDFSDALAAASDPAAIEAAITAYADTLVSLEPPEDAAAFHAAFIAYTRALIDDPNPTSDPPEPRSTVKRRLDNQARSLSACKATNYFGT